MKRARLLEHLGGDWKNPFIPSVTTPQGRRAGSSRPVEPPKQNQSQTV